MNNNNTTENRVGQARKLQPIVQNTTTHRGDNFQRLEIISIGNESQHSQQQNAANNRMTKSKARQCPTSNQLERSAVDNVDQVEQQEKIDQIMQIRQKQNNSEFKRKSSQSVVLFNGNHKISDFKKSIPELIIHQKTNNFSSQKKKQAITHGSNTIYEGFPQINTNEMGSKLQQEMTREEKNSMDSPSNEANEGLPKFHKLVSITQSRQSMRHSDHNNNNNQESTASHQIRKSAMNTHLDIGNKNDQSNQICSGSESVRYKNKHSIHSISQSRQSMERAQSDGSNYQSNETLKKTENQDNNYADNEGSKSLSSINFKSSNRGSKMNSYKKDKSKASQQNQQAQSSEEDIDQKEFSVYDSIKAKQVKMIKQITEEKPENEVSSPESMSKSFKKHREFYEFQKKLTPLHHKELDKKNLKFEKINCQQDLDDSQVRPQDRSPNKNQAYPPPEDIYVQKKKITQENTVKFGLNMCFRKYHPWSADPSQGGGELNVNQRFSSQPWGVMGCPYSQQENICEYVKNNIKNVVFSRYGKEYLKSFPRADDMAIGSWKINLDYLIFQKQKQISAENEDNIVGMSFLKTKGQFQNLQQEKRLENQLDGSQAQGPHNMIIPFYKQLGPDEQKDTLQFDSVFESGNLAIAIQVSDKEYNCILQNDINTNGHTQWFYFKVKSNFAKKTDVKLNLINLYKHKSLYQYGLKILVLDVTNQPKPDKTFQTEKEPVGEKPPLPSWKRCGKDICYTQNKYTNECCPTGLFQVSFTYEFPKGQKELYFAHSCPYTYTMLNDYLNKNVTKEKAKRMNLCYSLAGNKIEYLYITNKSKKQELPSLMDNTNDNEANSNVQSKKRIQIDSSSPVKSGAASPLKKKVQQSITKREQSLSPSKKKAETKQIEKQVILFTSRVHPGETNASWMIEGLMDTLLNPKNDKEEELVNNLKDHFEIYIIPMLNVDGVINGNYRCSLAACDLNRKWSKPSKTLHPPVYYTKKLCQNLMEIDKKNFFLYLDFHGHSAKKNIFQYGNQIQNLSNYRQVMHKMNQPSLFPLILSRQFDYFKFEDCTYTMPPTKSSTARISMFHKLKIPYVFTLEASFAGASMGQLSGNHFSNGDLMNVGKYVLQAIWELKKLELNKNLLKQVTEEANLITKNQGENEGDDSDGCSSTDEEMQIPQKKKLPLEMIPQEGESPGLSTKRDCESPNNSLSNTRRQNNAQSPIKTKVGFNKSIINLKTIGTENDNGGTISAGGGVSSPEKGNSPRKYDRRGRPEPNAQMRRSMGRNYEDQGTFQDAVRQLQGRQGENKSKAQSPIGFSNISNLVRQNQQNNPDKNETATKLDIFKNIVKTEKPDGNSSDYRTISSEIQVRQQELFEQFNQEIERSFNQQQQNLDEIFRKTAKHFMEITQKQQGSQLQMGKQLLNNNFDPFSTGSGIFSQGMNKNPFGMSQSGFMHGGKNYQQRTNPQIQTLLQLQKLHQMQKLNQIAQMQFFRQQAELLLNQNLSQQQQLELFQQFSFYQAQIQMQNQQYQIMLNQSLHGNYMANFQKTRDTNVPSHQQDTSNHRQRRFTPSNIDQFGQQRFNQPQQQHSQQQTRMGMPEVNNQGLAALNLGNSSQLNASDWENSSMSAGQDQTFVDQLQRTQPRVAGQSNQNNFQSTGSNQRITRNSVGKLNKQISDKYHNRPRTKSNGVQFGVETSALTSAFQSFMEDDINIKNKMAELPQADGATNNSHHYQMQQATSDMMMNSSERSKQYSQANSYNKQSTTRSSNLTRAAKLSGQQAHKFNFDVLTIKRDSVKFLDKDYTTAPTIEEGLQQQHQNQGVSQQDQSVKHQEALSPPAPGHQTNQSVSIIKSQFKERQGNMRYSNKSLQSTQIYQSSSAQINSSQSMKEKESGAKQKNDISLPAGRTIKAQESDNFGQKYMTASAENSINNNKMVQEASQTFVASPRKQQAEQCNIKFFSQRDTRMNKRNIQGKHQRSNLQANNQQQSDGGSPQIHATFALPSTSKKQQ